MKTTRFVWAAASWLLVPALASAQQSTIGEKPYLSQSVAAPTQALELTVGTGYTQGFGKLQSSVGMPDVAQAGIGFDLGAGYRLDPRWGLSIGGQYQELSAQRAGGARGLSATIASQFHIDPTVRLDPWVELGAGYRMLWETETTSRPSLLTHGLEIARARVGFDVRVSPEIAFSPVVGADATMFLWQEAASTSSTIARPGVSSFVFAGVQGRLDIGGGKVGTTSTTAATPE